MRILIFIGCLLGLLSSFSKGADDVPLSKEGENIWHQLEVNKKSLIDLNRQLLNLEQEILFPPSTQIKIFLSLTQGKFFALDSIEIELDNKLVSSHLYTKRELTALNEGAVHDVFLGNLKSGNHHVVATLIGLDDNKRTIKRAISMDFNKNSNPSILHLNIKDNEISQRVDFSFKIIDPLL